MNEKLSRPKIKPKMYRFDYILEVIAISAFLVTWGLILYYIPSLPDKVAIHFNFEGKADGFGLKNSLYFEGALSTLVYGGLSFASLFTPYFNYIVTITEKNAERQYMLASRMLRVTKLFYLLCLVYSTYQQIAIAMGREENLGIAFVPLLVISNYVILFIYLIVSTSKKRIKCLN